MNHNIRTFGRAVWRGTSGAPLAAAALLLAPLPVAAGPSDPGDGMRSVEIQFEARVGDAPFQCGLTYDGVGLHSSTISPRDLRMYVSGFSLVLADGSSHPLELEQDGLWQHQDLVLLDFEDGTGDCRNGNPQTRDVVRGLLPEGEIRGVRFTFGVPWELNHINQATAPSPLSLTSMFWSWNVGYKFLRTELGSDELPQGFHVHIGSMACTPSERATQPPTECLFPSRTEVAFDNFDPATDRIVFDLAELLSNSDLSGEADMTRCMGVLDHEPCAPVYEALGLPFGEHPGGEQRVFRLETVR